MKKIIKQLLIFLILFTIPVCNAQDSKVLTGSVTMVPKTFYGTWRVVSLLENCDSKIFKEKSFDIWNISQTSNVITLSNPFNGAKAEITVSNVNEENIVFTKSGKYGEKILIDRVELSIKNKEFVGTNKLQLETYSNGVLMKTETAIYKLKGEKIAGDIEVN